MDTPMRPRQMPRTRRKRSVLASCDEVIRESSRRCLFYVCTTVVPPFSCFVYCGSAIRSCLQVLVFTLVDFSLYSIVFMALVGISFPLSPLLASGPGGPVITATITILYALTTLTRIYPFLYWLYPFLYLVVNGGIYIPISCFC